ncbi:MAG: hypothetical protein JWM35_2277 [Verrucomicrobia bacterium]|nr:hypothetical protein [Verrucomicrobiota bacterium]
MKVSSLLFVGLNASDRGIAADGAKNAFPKAALADAATVDDALKREPGNDGEILVLSDAAQASLAEAQAAVNAAGGPRWGIVAIGANGNETSSTVSLPREDWNAKAAARAMQTAARLHALESETVQLRGDLSTIGRRISHDLRAPLSGIFSAIDAINESASGAAADRTVFTQSIASSADEIVQLIDRVSFLLKTSAEAHESETVLMGEIIFATLQRFEKVILKKGAAVTQPASWPVVVGHPASLEIIWTNLIGNALKFGGEKPQIELGWTELDGEFQFWIEDHGPGVRPDRIDRLFQPFNLLHRLNAARGIGLALVRRLTELQGGTCGYEPRPGGGARFYFTLNSGNVTSP